MACVSYVLTYIFTPMATATAQIHLRTPPKTKSLLSLAADLSGAPNLTDYILRAAV